MNPPLFHWTSFTKTSSELKLRVSRWWQQNIKPSIALFWGFCVTTQGTSPWRWPCSRKCKSSLLSLSFPLTFKAHLHYQSLQWVRFLSVSWGPSPDHHFLPFSPLNPSLFPLSLPWFTSLSFLIQTLQLSSTWTSAVSFFAESYSSSPDKSSKETFGRRPPCLLQSFLWPPVDCGFQQSSLTGGPGMETMEAGSMVWPTQHFKKFKPILKVWRVHPLKCRS